MLFGFWERRRVVRLEGKACRRAALPVANFYITKIILFFEKNKHYFYFICIVSLVPHPLSSSSASPLVAGLPNGPASMAACRYYLQLASFPSALVNCTKFVPALISAAVVRASCSLSKAGRSRPLPPQ